MTSPEHRLTALLQGRRARPVPAPPTASWKYSRRSTERSTRCARSLRTAPSRWTRTLRTGRRPGESGTRDALLEVARSLFAERGYEGASLRAIAAAAGVDAALVAHFFGSKAELLAAAAEWPFDPDAELPRLLARGPDHVGEALSELFLRVWDDQGQRNPLLTLLRAATTEPRAARLLDEFLRTRLLGPLFAQLGSDQPELRRDLVISQLAGLALTRYILRFEPIASTPAEQLIPRIAPTLQRYLAGTL